MKLVADVDKITSNLSPLATTIDDYATAVSTYDGASIDCQLSEIKGDLDALKSSIGNDLNTLNKSSQEYNLLIEDCCQKYKDNESNVQTINIDEINEIISNNKEVTVDYKGTAAQRLKNLPTTELMPAALVEAKKVVEKYNGRKIADLSNEEFVDFIASAARIDYDRSGILPSVTVAQAILESGWGNSSIGNNVFGIKCGTDWTGKRINCATSEQAANGSYYGIRADFRDYDSVLEGVGDHNDLLNGDRYITVKNACNNNDPYEACRQLQNCGYATSQSYASKLISLIKDYNLTQYDPEKK